MKISKTMFKEYIRCDRFAALDELRMNKENAVVAFKEDATLEDLMSYENTYKTKELLKSLHDYEDPDEEINTNENIFQEDFDKLEIITGNLVKNKFGKEVIFKTPASSQKSFSTKTNFDELYCFLDVYQEDENYIRVFETKATTSKKFIEIEFGNKDNKQSVFLKNHGIYELRKPTKDNKQSYETAIKKFFNKSHEAGSYVYDLAYQAYVIEKSTKSLKQRRYFLVTLNHNYTYDGKKNQLNEYEYTEDILSIFDFTPIIHDYILTIESDIQRVLRRVNELNASPIPLGKYCEKSNKKRICPFVDICFNHIPEKNSMMVYLNRQHGYLDNYGNHHEFFDLLNSGMVKALDLPEDYLDFDVYINKKKNTNRIIENKIQKEVIQKWINERNDTPYVRKEEIKKIINQFKYPIYHLDFETMNAPLPRFKGETPYTQSLYQFSLHIEQSPSSCDFDKDHYDYLAKNHEDHRRELVETMLNYIKDDEGTIIVWFAPFERGRIKEMITLFPEYQERLQRIHDRIYDLKLLFFGDSKICKDSQFNFYHHALQGSFSIKKVLPIFSDKKHSELEVQDGNMAMKAFKNLPYLAKIEHDKTYQELRDYCKLDTYAMVEILRGIRKLI